MNLYICNIKQISFNFILISFIVAGSFNLNAQETTTPLPFSEDYTIYSTCSDLPTSRQRDRCNQLDQEYRNNNNNSYFENFVLINRTTELSAIFVAYYDEIGSKPPTAFFLDRRQGEGIYSINREIEPEGSFALIGIKDNNMHPEIETTNAFNVDSGRDNMLQIDASVIDNNLVDLMVIDGVKFDPIAKGGSNSDLLSTISSDSDVSINKIVINDCVFNDVSRDHDEHIYIQNAIGEVRITNNTFSKMTDDNTLDEEAVDIKCLPGQGNCSTTKVYFTNNNISAERIPHALRLEEISSFEIAFNIVTFGSTDSGSSSRPIFRIEYEYLSSIIPVSGVINNNTFTGLSGTTVSAVDIYHSLRSDNINGSQQGVIYHHSNAFGNRSILKDSSLPLIELRNEIPSLMPTITPGNPCSSGLVANNSSCEISGGTIAGLAVLGGVAALSTYEAIALVAFSISKAAMHAPEDISTAWHLATLGVSAIVKKRMMKGSYNTQQ